MKVTFVDCQDESNPANGAVLTGAEEVECLLQEQRRREPFMFQMESENGYALMAGIGWDVGCVQIASSDGMPPYLVAVGNGSFSTNQEFMMGGTPTEIEKRFCLSFSTLAEITKYFVATGERCPDVEWEEI